MKLWLVLPDEWSVIDADLKPSRWVKVPAGVYEAERVTNPLIAGTLDWIVIKGTRKGQAVEGWKSDGKRGAAVIEAAEAPSLAEAFRCRPAALAEACVAGEDWGF